VHLVKEIM